METKSQVRDRTVSAEKRASRKRLAWTEAKPPNRSSRQIGYRDVGSTPGLGERSGFAQDLSNDCRFDWLLAAETAWAPDGAGESALLAIRSGEQESESSVIF